MGAEARIRAQYGELSGEGRARLEFNKLEFRGDFKLDIPLNQVTHVSAAEGTLRLQWADEEAFFELGPAAAKWADKIDHPSTRLDKLGIKSGTVITLLGEFDADFRAELERAGAQISSGPVAESSVVLVLIQTREELYHLAGLRKSIAPNGAIWTVHRKARKDLNESMIMKAARAAGLVDTKTARFSETHTALKWVIPTGDRKPEPKPDRWKRRKK